MEFFKITQDIYIFILLAYIGAFVHFLLKIQEKSLDKKFNLFIYIKKNIITIATTVILIPLIIYIISDTSLSQQIPLTRLTAVFTGYGAQSIFKSLMIVAGNKFKKS